MPHPTCRRPTPTLRGLLHALAVGTVLVATWSCGSSLHLLKEARAQRSLQEARELGAERYAPFEFYAAETRLIESNRQAAHAEYGTAAQLSAEAERYSREAIRIAQRARRHSEVARGSAAPE